MDEGALKRWGRGSNEAVSTVNFSKLMIEALSELHDALKNHGVEGNFTRPENLHLTLGSVEK